MQRSGLFQELGRHFKSPQVEMSAFSLKRRGVTVWNIIRNLHKTRNVFVLYYFEVQELLHTPSRSIEAATPSREKMGTLGKNNHKHI